MSKIKVLVIPPDRFGVGFYRSVNPHVSLDKYYGENYDITFNYNIELMDYDIEYFKKFDIVHFSKTLSYDFNIHNNLIIKLKEHNIKTVLDIDDYWDLGEKHPLNIQYINHDIPNKLKKNIVNADVITTTTKHFLQEIKNLNNNCVIIPNTIDPTEKQFKRIEKKSKRIRFGIICGSAHEYDINLLKGVVGKLKKEGLLDKIQFVLCGFDTNGTITTYKEDGTFVKRNLKPEETVWVKYEKVLTDNYSIVSDNYKTELLKYRKDTEQLNETIDEPYVRYWTKSVDSYCEHYNNIDVLLAPLVETMFNKVKSQLKVVECGIMGKAIIAQNYGPYTIDIIPLIGKNNSINKDGNGLLVNTYKNDNQWFEYIKFLTINPDLIELMSNNLSELVFENYTTKTDSDIRHNLYCNLIKK